MSDHLRAFFEALFVWLKEHWGLFAAWAGSVALAQWQAAVGIASGLAVLVYTVLNTYYLWRRNRRHK